MLAKEATTGILAKAGYDAMKDGVFKSVVG